LIEVLSLNLEHAGWPVFMIFIGLNIYLITIIRRASDPRGSKKAEIRLLHGFAGFFYGFILVDVLFYLLSAWS
jgi:hypothetical protein